MANTDLTPVDGEQIVRQFNAIIANDTTNSLANSWHYLQLYSYWGTYLPNTEATLKLKLNVKDPGAYDFFTPMLEAYQGIHQSSNQFITQVFPQVVALGNDLKKFAADATLTDASIFSAVLALLDENDTASALELILDLQKQAVKNSESAKKVTELLATYKNTLADSSGKLDNVKKKVDGNAATSQKRISELMGNEDDLESIKHLTKEIEDTNDAYNHNVVVASTTVTYAWVFPAGTIAAIVVAGVYGDRAVKTLKNLEELRSMYIKKSNELAVAITTQEVQQNALKGVGSALELTNLAIQHTTDLQNAWNGIDTQLELVKDKLNLTTTTTDNDVALRAKAIVKTYINQAGRAWETIVDPLKQLTAKPYISISNTEVSLTEFIEEVRKEVPAPANV